MKNHRRHYFAWGACAAVLVLVFGAWRLSSAAEDAEKVTLAPAPPAADNSDATQPDPFAVPDGSAEDLLNYIDQVAHPETQFETSAAVAAYMTKAATSIGAAAEKVLAQKATAPQQVQAVHWRLESFRIEGQLGNADADKQADAFLDDLQKTASPQLTVALKELRLIRNLKQWRTLDTVQRTQVVDDFIADMQQGDMSNEQIFLLYRFVDMLSDTPDSTLAIRMVDQLLPKLKENADPDAKRIVTEIEGIGRRINLPGHQIEIEGTFLDGKPIDWQSYRGKVVLLDFWATNCGFCLAEVPNLLENYRLFHDKGFDIVGVCMDSTRAPVEHYMEQSGIPWQTLFQENSSAEGWDHPVATKYAISAIPRLILVDQEGNVVSMNARGRKLTAELQRLLGSPAEKQSPNPDDEASNRGPVTTLTVAPAAP